jgi:hypothetical protein
MTKEIFISATVCSLLVLEISQQIIHTDRIYSCNKPRIFDGGIRDISHNFRHTICHYDLMNEDSKADRHHDEAIIFDVGPVRRDHLCVCLIYH